MHAKKETAHGFQILFFGSKFNLFLKFRFPTNVLSILLDSKPNTVDTHAPVILGKKRRKNLRMSIFFLSAFR